MGKVIVEEHPFSLEVGFEYELMGYYKTKEIAVSEGYSFMSGFRVCDTRTDKIVYEDE